MKRTTAIAAVVLFLSACSTDVPARVQHDLGGGLVTAWWDVDNGVPVVRVSIEPTIDGYHAYALDYDRASTDGVGVPTQIELAGEWSVAGPITADHDVEALTYPLLGIELPVYPSGKVVFTVPARRAQAATTQPSAPSNAAVVVLTFALCSTSRCLRPVQGSAIPVEGDSPS